MQSLAKLAVRGFRTQYANLPTKKSLQFHHQSMQFKFLNLNSSRTLSQIRSIQFSSEKKCKNDSSKVCENKGDCGSQGHSHSQTGCHSQNHQENYEDPDISKLKELLNSVSPNKGNKEHECCGGSHHNDTKATHGGCGGGRKHEHQNGCCGGHKNQNNALNHEHTQGECGGHNHQQESCGHTHQHQHGGCGHHHEHDHAAHHHQHGGCGHHHEHDHAAHNHQHGGCGHNHHGGQKSQIDLSEIEKQKTKEKDFTLKSGESVKAVFSENTVSYSLSDKIKGVKARDQDHGQFVMMFTCTVCETRSTRAFTKKAYNEGVVLIRCESCDNLHLIADNLGWFNDDKSNIETIMEEKGEKVHTIKDSDEINQLLSFFINREDDSQADQTKNS